MHTHILDHVNLKNIWISFYISEVFFIYTNTYLSLSQLSRAVYESILVILLEVKKITFLTYTDIYGTLYLLFQNTLVNPQELFILLTSPVRLGSLLWVFTVARRKTYNEDFL